MAALVAIRVTSYWVRNVSGAAIVKNAISATRMVKVHAPLDMTTRRSRLGSAGSSTADWLLGLSTVDSVSLTARSVSAQGTGHGTDQLLDRGLGGGETGHPPTQPQHLDPVGDGQHLRHVVADQHDRDAAVADPSHGVEHAAALYHPERGGRLVHEDHLAGVRNGP